MEKIKSYFIKDREIQNKHLATGSVDGRTIKEGSVSTEHIAAHSIKLSGLAADLRALLLPNRDTYLALANSVAPAADNPFVTRNEIYSYRNHWKDPVQTFDDLPEDANEGDVRLVLTGNDFGIFFYVDGSWRSQKALASAIAGPSPTAPPTQTIEFVVRDFSVLRNEYEDVIHAKDVNYNRIVQVKELIEGSDEASTALSFDDGSDSIFSSRFSINETRLYLTSKQVIGVSTVVWDPGICGLVATDDGGNKYRIDSITVQNATGASRIINLETPIRASSAGRFNVSNCELNGGELVLVRQKNVSDFVVFEGTINQSESAKNVQVFGSKETGISAIASIRQDGSVRLEYNCHTCDEQWQDYRIKYKYSEGSDVEIDVLAQSFHIVHLPTLPTSAVLGQTVSDLGRTDMYAMAYVEKTTKRPFLVAWCHNFGEPIFMPRVQLSPLAAGSGVECEDIHLAIREWQKVSTDFLAGADVAAASRRAITTGYVVAVTASTITDSHEDKIALWLNDNAGPTFLSNWAAVAGSGPILSPPNTYGQRPRVLIGPAIMDDGVGAVNHTTDYRVYIIYRDESEEKIKSVAVPYVSALDGDNNPIVTYNFTELLKGGAFVPSLAAAGITYGGAFDAEFVTGKSFTLFSSSFRSGSKYDFDAALWEDVVEPGVMFDDTSESNEIYHWRGTPIVVGADGARSGQLEIQYKKPDYQPTSWTNSIDIAGKFGSHVKVKVESKASRINGEATTRSNADTVHVFYVNRASGSVAVPCHVHNKFGCWMDESSGNNQFNCRVRNFSQPIEFLDYVGLVDFDCDFSDIGTVEFAGFFDSDSERGLYYSAARNYCRFNVWNRNNFLAGPGIRAGAAKFHYGGHLYIQGGYGVNGRVDSSMWRYNPLSGVWTEVPVDNGPNRVFHVATVVKNVAYRGLAADQVAKAAVNPKSTLDGVTEIAFPADTSKVWVDPTDFNASYVEEIIDGKSTKLWFVHYVERDENHVDGDVQEKITGKARTVEGYRDSIINFELHNLTTGGHGKILDVSVPETDGQVCIKIGSVFGGSRAGTQFLLGDKIVISSPDCPAHDQVVMYGGGTQNLSSSYNFPDDLEGQITRPPDTVAFGSETNIGDTDVYSDARTTFVADLDSETDCGEVKFVPARMAPGGSQFAPTPCVSGNIVAIGYERDATGGISGTPNLVLYNRSNAYRFKTTYMQSSGGYDFLGSWTKLDPAKSTHGEPIEGLSAWMGAELRHWGGFKPAPKGHSDVPYVESVSNIFFGGFTRSDFDPYYSNSVLVSNAHDVNPGWTLVKTIGDQAPPARSGNGIIVVNRKMIERLDVNGEVAQLVDMDTDQEIWIAGGNDKDISKLKKYESTSAMDDVWAGKLRYARRRSSSYIPGNPIYFAQGSSAIEASADVKLNAGYDGMIVPNGLRGSNNILNSRKELVFRTRIKFHAMEIAPARGDRLYGSQSGVEGRVIDVDLNSYGWMGVSGWSGWSGGSGWSGWVGQEGGELTVEMVFPENEVPGHRVMRNGVIANAAQKIITFAGNGTWGSGAYTKGFLTIMYGPNMGRYTIENYSFNGATHTITVAESFSATGTGIVATIVSPTFRASEDLLLDGPGGAKVCTTAADHVLWFAPATDKNDRYSELSVFDLAFEDLAHYGTGDWKIPPIDRPDWITPVDYDQNNDLYIPERVDVDNGGSITGAYWPAASPNMGERRWTVLARLGLVIQTGPGACDADDPWWVYVAVYNNGVNSYVEYYFPQQTKYALASANIELSGGKYDPNPLTTSGKSWFDVGTGTLHLKIRKVTEEQFVSGLYPYISRIENVNFVELSGVEWSDFSSELGLKPFKTTWAAMAADPKDPTTAVYHGGRTHADSMVGDTFNLSPPATKIRGEKTRYYVASEIDGWGDENRIQLKHGNILRVMPDAPQMGDAIDNFVDVGGSYAAWGIARIIVNRPTAAGTTKNRACYNVAFHVVDNGVDPGADSDLDGSMHRGMGYITSETIYNVGGAANSNFYFRGELEFATGKLYVRFFVSNDADFSEEDVLFRIEEINYATLDGAVGSKYTVSDKVYSRTIGDKTGGEFVANEGGTYESDTAEITAAEIVSLRDDRCLSATLDYSVYDPDPLNSPTSVKIGDAPKYSGVGQDQVAVFDYVDAMNAPAWLTAEIFEAARKAGDTSTSSYGPYNIASLLTGAHKAIFMVGKITIERPREANVTESMKIVQYFYVKPNGQSTEVVLQERTKLLLVKDGVTSLYNQNTDPSHIFSGGSNIDNYLVSVTSITGLGSDNKNPAADMTFTLLGSGNGDQLKTNVITIDLIYLNKNLMTLPVTLTSWESFMKWGGNSLKTLFSFDDGETWKRYDQSTDLWIATNPEDVLELGMEIDELDDIVSLPWSGWNNAVLAEERGLPANCLGFERGKSDSIKMMVGIKTADPASTPALNKLVFNFYSGMYWEPKNVVQYGETPNTGRYVQVKMISPTLTRIINKHPTSTARKTFKATVLLKRGE